MSECLFAFEVSVVGAPWPASIINAQTHGQAKAEYFRSLRDPWPSIPFTALRCRKVGGPSTSPAFLRTARYRGVPGARCGDFVRTKDGSLEGFIVGNNDSANFDVLVNGVVLNIHPHELVWDREVRNVA